MLDLVHTYNHSYLSTHKRCLEVFVKIYCFFFSVGLDAAGKTTILYKLKLGEVVTTIPTIGEFILFLRL